MKHRDRLTGQSALQAYQSDIPLGGMEPTPEDQAAVLVATLLRQSLISDDEATTSRIRAEAAQIAKSSLGEAMLAHGCTYDDHPAESTTDVVRLLAQRTDHAGRLRLAQHLLESAAEFEADQLAAGRILSDRTRVARKLGQLDLSFEQNHTLLRVARRIRSPELAARAHYGLAALAETRGNYVDFRAHVLRVIRIARSARLQRLHGGGHSGLGTSDAMAGRYGDAVANFWKAFELSGGTGQLARTVLGNLAQTLLISGRPTEARKVSTKVLQDAPSLAVAIPMLGTFAIASAQLGDSDGVHWASAQVRQAAKSRSNARDVAEALMECSAALEAIGEAPQSGVMKRRAEAIAVQYGFHALTFQDAMLAVSRVGQPSDLNTAGTKAAAAILDMEVPRIPILAAALTI